MNNNTNTNNMNDDADLGMMDDEPVVSEALKIPKKAIVACSAFNFDDPIYEGSVVQKEGMPNILTIMKKLGSDEEGIQTVKKEFTCVTQPIKDKGSNMNLRFGIGVDKQIYSCVAECNDPDNWNLYAEGQNNITSLFVEALPQKEDRSKQSLSGRPVFTQLDYNILVTKEGGGAAVCDYRCPPENKKSTCKCSDTQNFTPVPGRSVGKSMVCTYQNMFEKKFKNVADEMGLGASQLRNNFSCITEEINERANKVYYGVSSSNGQVYKCINTNNQCLNDFNKWRPQRDTLSTAALVAFDGSKTVLLGKENKQKLVRTNAAGIPITYERDTGKHKKGDPMHDNVIGLNALFTTTLDA